MSSPRRQFIKNAATALAAGVFLPTLVPARALGRDGSVAPSNRIALGLVGAGYGLNVAAQFFRFPDVVFSAACDVDAKRLSHAERILNNSRSGTAVRTFRDFGEMFAGEKLDAVILAAPDHWHSVMAVAAARAGLDIYAEAPLARTPEEGRAIVNTTALHGRVFQSGMWRSSSPEYTAALDLVLAGRLGQITHVEVGAPPTLTYAALAAAAGKPPASLDYERWVGPGAWMDYDSRFVHHYWRWVSSYGGGELADTAGHYVDIALRGIGMSHSGPATISGRGEFSTTLPYDVERNYRCVFTFGNGVQMVLSSSFPLGVKFHGERGWLHIGDRPAAPAGARPSASAVPAFFRVSDPELLDAPPAPTRFPTPAGGHWRNFVDCVKSRAVPVASAEVAHRVATVTRLAHAAILTGHTLHWDSTGETLKNDPGVELLLRPFFRAPWGL
jgi:predicted dehydrogenase